MLPGPANRPKLRNRGGVQTTHRVPEIPPAGSRLVLLATCDGPDRVRTDASGGSRVGPVEYVLGPAAPEYG